MLSEAPITSYSGKSRNFGDGFINIMEVRYYLSGYIERLFLRRKKNVSSNIIIPVTPKEK